MVNNNNKYSPRFERIVSWTIERETGGDKHGGYTNDPNDAGGPTKWGISQKAFPLLSIKDLTYKDATDIYYKEYWNQLYEIIPSELLAAKIFDLSVLFGVKTVVKELQYAIKKHKTIATDGKFGPLTLTALTMSSVEVPVDYINELIERMKNYVKLITLIRNRKYRQGWLNRIDRKYEPKGAK